MQTVTFTESSIRFRQYVVLGIFLFLIVLTSFFSGEWNRWIHSIFLILTFPLTFFSMMLLRGEHTQAARGKMWQSPFVYLTIFLVVVLVTSFFSVQLYESLHQLTLLICYGIFFWVAATVLRTPFFLRLTSIVIYCTGVIASVVGLVLYIINPIDRVGGLLYNANAFGSYLLFSLLLGFVLALSAQSKRNKILLWSGTLVILSSFLLTFSFTAWVSLLIPLAFILWQYRKKVFTKKSIPRILIAILILFIVAVGARYLSSGNLSGAFKLHRTIPLEGIAESFDQRVQFISSAVNIFFDNPLSGSGLSTYQDLYPQYTDSSLEQPRYAHNYYIQLAAEIGIFGVLTFLSLIIALLYKCFVAVERTANDSTRYPYVLGLTLGILASAIHALFDFGWHFPGVFVLFWVAGGIVIAQVKPLDEPGTEKKGWVHISAIAIVVLGLLLMVRGVSLVASERYYDKAERQRSQGGINEPIALYEQAIVLDPSPTKLKRQAGLLYEQASIIPDYNPDSYFAAEELTSRALKWSDIDDSGYNLLGRIYFVLKDFDRAEREYKKAIELNPVFKPDFYYDLAALYYKQDNYTRAVSTIEDILGRYGTMTKTANPRLQTQLSFLNLLLGQSHRALGEYDLAEEALLRALEINADFELATQELAGVLQDRAGFTDDSGE